MLRHSEKVFSSKKTSNSKTPQHHKVMQRACHTSTTERPSSCCWLLDDGCSGSARAIFQPLLSVHFQARLSVLGPHLPISGKNIDKCIPWDTKKVLLNRTTCAHRTRSEARLRFLRKVGPIGWLVVSPTPPTIRMSTTNTLPQETGRVGIAKRCSMSIGGERVCLYSRINSWGRMDLYPPQVFVLLF